MTLHICMNNGHRVARDLHTLTNLAITKRDFLKYRTLYLVFFCVNTSEFAIKNVSITLSFPMLYITNIINN